MRSAAGCHGGAVSCCPGYRPFRTGNVQMLVDR
jgi:hypothetical protein